jgi:hypothetical protein
MTNELVVWGTITAMSIASVGIHDATVVKARPALPPLDDISLNLDDDVVGGPRKPMRIRVHIM